ncbi:3-hydroxybutyryl-CoA dehydrogenase [Alicyclobacillus mali]|uniref:3-hydroxybutyryl-CoA dehydrogenase n=1 Tax=Alicyclobacillus mali (ex Roth et al. 2021) TaxID=1123961 RepID=A0ABS0F4F2_9BACL|nr:3-hydroxyacyl-CoA dehydrogenase NAD-binding domain-containing protein [Alicyclobacillus mali (ex Roth et al. 2021)]MBF8378177.1 3-hydroxybutyryl-CoA dehydrogenase [Alicyclobacillus mali (ex Roth et al. 2021)]MCL6487559.1 3-hydroxybutyryl-CoA dehydrogenase [Alicyclobacillus mali (ex Roth et al. 2021)]
MDVQTVGVIGAGFIGRGVAMAAALGGMRVHLYDADEEVLERSLLHMGQRLAARSRHYGLTPGEMEEVLRRIRTVPRLESACAADLVIEAIPEDLQAKLAVWRDIDGFAPGRAVLATTTSTISITELSGATSRPEWFLGLHFPQPPTSSRVVEVVRGYVTCEEAHELALRFCRRAGLTPIQTIDVPPFLVQRLLIPFIHEGIRALQEGVASASDIDEAMRLALQHPVGPLQLADRMGLDHVLAISEKLARETGDSRYLPPRLLRQMVRAGKLGRKSGEGFYVYDEDATAPASAASDSMRVERRPLG